VFALTPDGNAGTDITVPCFRLGTLILTERGDMPVEALRAGDRLVTVSGAVRPVC
jgi:hypothetical protein